MDRPFLILIIYDDTLLHYSSSASRAGGIAGATKHLAYMATDSALLLCPVYLVSFSVESRYGTTGDNDAPTSELPTETGENHTTGKN